jgi:hypothetical protein
MTVSPPSSAANFTASRVTAWEVGRYGALRKRPATTVPASRIAIRERSPMSRRLDEIRAF